MALHAPTSRAAKATLRPVGALVRGALLWGLLAAAIPTRASAQVEPLTPLHPITDSASAAGRGSPARGVSPRGAFLRAVLLPGWGHAAIGAWNRGAFYMTIEGATAWALVKSQKRLQEAAARVAFRDRVVRTELAAQNQVDPDTVQAALDADETLQDLQELQESRRQQREDWTALGIFFLFLSGADAYVSTHLQHFPQPIEVNAVPVGGGRMELSVSVKLPR